MLSDLAVGSTMDVAQAILDILDHWCLLVQRATGYDEGFGSSKLGYDIR